MSSLFNIIGATLVVSFFSLVGIYALSLKDKTLHKILLILVSFSAGTILGASYFDLLPEALELVEESLVFVYITLGFVSFFFLERFIYWYHGHGHEVDISAKMIDRAGTKGFAYLNLIGDGVHNFIDGMIIAASFLIPGHGISVGLATTIAVIFHELPQEMGDYGILVYGGFKRRQALMLNFIVALMVVLGGISAFFFIGMVETLSGLLIALAAGGFIYLAASELIPELHKEKNMKKSVVQFAIFIIGVTLMWLLGVIFPE
ncbi:MAG: ZIP family metal transporter [Candidatus Bathyarchaeota archaeon]|nr:MAG: ZIP family metal transporter [Candidatus Bathyarchaeota archaeon]